MTPQAAKGGRTARMSYGLMAPSCATWGDLDHDLTAEQVKEIGKADVMFTPVAGGATIGPDVAWSVVTKLGPKVVIPMHYSSGRSAGPRQLSSAMPIPLDEFLKDKKNIDKIIDSTFSVIIDSLPKQQEIVVPRLPV
jgi:L-ascorbate metabolism protein UlaG (beta-lactamase superfamily)